MTIKINLENIQTLTDFKRNAKDYVERIKTTKSPLILTVNGKAEVVVHEAQAFQEMINQLERMEKELEQLKLEALKREIAIGIEQIENGQYTEYDEDSIATMFDQIAARGRKRLADNGNL
ncbi:MAG TPA: type II toxin-antitoxin system prevent-host-death family antitoxin [Nostocaceae cyanobacterium]|nr:type II toxin-antitoxin system prevent-host-death family antitoxin [Nostocaceae cyanobacterium]